MYYHITNIYYIKHYHIIVEQSPLYDHINTLLYNKCSLYDNILYNKCSLYDGITMDKRSIEYLD